MTKNDIDKSWIGKPFVEFCEYKKFSARAKKSFAEYPVIFLVNWLCPWSNTVLGEISVTP